MLSRLEIKDFALIENATIDFSDGLTILTGETGAGKSILIDSIGAITGNRTNKDVVRHGCDVSTITGVFDYIKDPATDEILVENSISTEDDTLIITREVYSNGKSFARINGKMVTLSVLKDITKNQLDIHGQHENQAIFRVETQAELLDRFAGDNIKNALINYREHIQSYKECIESLKEFIIDEEQKTQMIDLLEYQINEIKTVRPRQDEDIKLSERRKIISNSEKIQSTLDKCYEYLNGESQTPALVAVGEAKNLVLHQLGDFEEYAPISDILIDLECQLDDVCMKIQKEISKIEVFPGEAQEIDERLDLLFKLKRKYGGSIQSVIEFYQNANEKLRRIRSSEEQAAILSKRKDELRDILCVNALELSVQRQATATILETSICNELQELGMKNIKFLIKIEHQQNPDSFPVNGLDHVEFLISPNAGEDLKPLSRIASGGEASRIMLAIKTILAQSDRIPLLIFDEVDTGISGRTAGLLGEKLLKISNNHQVLCVTHMAQIAAKAKNHIFIEKSVVENDTKTSINYLNEEGRILEIARLLSGGANMEKALELATEMLANK